MRKFVLKCLTFALSLFIVACAALLNSSRPAYKGPLIKPAWHNSTINVAATPVIQNGVVYAIARPANVDTSHLYAFDLNTGRQLWVTASAPRRILAVEGEAILLADSSDRAHAVDARSGRDIAFASIGTLEYATSADGAFYIVGGNGQVWAVDRSGQLLWQATVPFNKLRPPLRAGGVVYVYGVFHVDLITPDLHALYAFDAKTGALRWKWQVKDHMHALSDVAADAGAVYLSVVHDPSPAKVRRTLRALDAASGKEKWNSGAAANAPCDPFLIGSDVVAVRDFPSVKDPQTDEAGYLFRGLARATGQPLWQATTSWKYESFTQQDGFLYVSDKKVHQVLNENNNVSPDSWVTKVDLRTGQEVWRTESVELGVFTLPAAGDGFVVVGSEPFRFNETVGKPDVAGLWAWRSQ